MTLGDAQYKAGQIGRHAFRIYRPSEGMDGWKFGPFWIESMGTIKNHWVLSVVGVSQGRVFDTTILTRRSETLDSEAICDAVLDHVTWEWVKECPLA